MAAFGKLSPKATNHDESPCRREVRPTLDLKSRRREDRDRVSRLASARTHTNKFTAIANGKLCTMAGGRGLPSKNGYLIMVNETGG